jgi:hypothetical protein
LKKFASLLFLLLTPILLGSNPVIHGLEKTHINKSDPQQIGSWEKTPTVLICPPSPATKEHALKAVKWWEARGHRFFRTIDRHDPLGKCKAYAPEGFITIHLAPRDMFEIDDPSLAETHFYVDDDTGEISWAKIYLRLTPDERVLEHELGHALGFMHTEALGHLMHGKILAGGWDDKGLKRR